ncbi:hypothetical protein AJ934_00040 [Campylobacter sp. BCW_6875]|uniref:hypothetical protein n=1 Tax=unclassified Campylobacter TaxID=2593542 RepID=UPI00087356EE|nr:MULTISPECIES: hypothetical protein [unclassified Campylobacter]OEW12300.1 hypothetical protein AJ934_00040 [Campylobacter sp. BCW_6875]OEW37098.1 hypothetical protein AJ881_03910 [Campylobacter sp. BCW_6460]HEB9274050.1 hypothetical protein [Campylobacter jejuni]HEB9277342.1 hypothetical protein [Campylobacter jejuni]
MSMENNNTIYGSLEIRKKIDDKFALNQNSANIRDFGNIGTLASYGMSITGATSGKILEQYMINQSVSTKVITFYKYKIMGNFGILSYLYKKAENKSNTRAFGEIAVETAIGALATSQIAINTIEIGISFISRIAAGAATGAAIGSSFPIVGTVVGTLVAGFFNDLIFGDEDEELKKQEAKEKYLEEKLDEKMHKIINYLITHQYIELRVLNEDEAEKLCKEISDINSPYFKTILLMLSFPYYLDKDEQSYKKAQEKNPTIIRIQPIANALNIKIEINECFLAKNGEALKNKEIYVYNHRFDRVVAKAMSDDEGKIVFENVYVGKESTIDKISFIIDRENFNEDNFYESVLKYAPMFNIQKKHKQKGQAFIDKMFFSFTYAQGIMQDNEVLKLEALKNNFNIVFDYEVRKQEESYKNYIILSYLVFDVKEDIEEYIRHTTIENRAFRGLELLGRGWKNQYSIKDEWRDKGVVFFAYFNSQKFTPYKKMAFIDKPIVILDIEKFDKEDILKDIKFHFKTLTKAYKICNRFRC